MPCGVHVCQRTAKHPQPRPARPLLTKVVAKAVSDQCIIGRDGGCTRLVDICCTMVYSDRCHGFSCSVMLELDSEASIFMKWPSCSAVLVIIWPQFNGNVQ